MNVKPTFKVVDFRLKLMHQKAFFMKKSNLIDVLFCCLIEEAFLLCKKSRDLCQETYNNEKRSEKWFGENVPRVCVCVCVSHVKKIDHL